MLLLLALRRLGDRSPLRLGGILLLAQLIVYRVVPGLLLAGVAPFDAAVGAVAVGCLGAAAAVVAFGGWRSAGFRAPMPWRSMLLTWPGVLRVGVVVVLATVPHVRGMFDRRTSLPPLALLAVLVALHEEMWFRGAILRALRPLGARRAALVSATAFALVHLYALLHAPLQPALIMAASALGSGLLYAALVERTGSLLPAIALHAAYDFAVFAARAGPGVEPWNAVATTGDSAGAALQVGLAAAVGGYGLWLLRDGVTSETAAAAGPSV